MTERRQHTRVVLQSPAKVITEDKVHSGEICDISLGGVRINGLVPVTGGLLAAIRGVTHKERLVIVAVAVAVCGTFIHSTPLEESVGSLKAPESGAAERRLAGGELREQVRKALTGLSPRSAEIFALRYFEGYENQEIARMLGSSKSTVAVVLHRARLHVREAIGPYTGHAGEER